MNQRTAIKAVSRATTPPPRADDAVLGDQIATVASEVEDGCGAERRQPEQEGELDRRGDAAPHGQCRGDGDETPTGTRPQREHLGQPDQGGATHGELIERHTATTLPPHDEEQATDDPRHHDGPGTEEQILDRLLEHRTDERGRQKGDDETHEQAAAGGVVADQPRCELADARPEDHHDCGDRSQLDGDRVGVGGDALGQPEQPLDHEQMPGRRDRQELGDALDGAEERRLGHRQLGPPPTGDDDGHENGDDDEQRPRRTTTAGRAFGGRGRWHPIGGLDPSHRATPAGDATRES